MPAPDRIARPIPWLALLAMLPLGGCASLTYYAQSVTGHLSLMAAREPIDEVLAEPDTDPLVRRKLETVRAARRFASEHLHLPENRSYAYYAELDRPYAVWNVVATPRYSLEPKRWCFPVAGCVSYRGYFQREDAEEKAHELAADGMDTAVLGATAYSTLGWFADPVLSTMLEYPDPRLAGLVFHELAHQQLYVKGDTAFNEAFAGVVEEVGVERWLRARDARSEENRWRRLRGRREAVTGFMLDAREGLEVLYARTDRLVPESLERRKDGIFDILRRRHSALAGTGAANGLPENLNNAHLALVGAYHGGAPAFRRLLACGDGDLERFYEAARAIGGWDKARRRAWLEGEESAPRCESPGSRKTPG